MNNPRNPAHRPPDSETPRQPWWLVALVIWSAVMVTLGSVDFGNALAAQLPVWGIPEAEPRLGRVVFLVPIFLSIWRKFESRGSDIPAVPLYANGFAWGAVFWLIDPAARVLIHLVAPDFAPTVDASIARKILFMLLFGAWIFIEHTRAKRAAMVAGGTGAADEETRA